MATTEQTCPLDGVVMTEVDREIGECGCLTVTFSCPGDCAGEMNAIYHRMTCPTVDPADVGTVSLRIEFEDDDA